MTLWDTNVISHYLVDQVVNMKYLIPCYPRMQLLILENCSLQNLENIHLLLDLRFVFVPHNLLYDLVSIQRLKHIISLDLSNSTGLDLPTFVSLSEMNIVYLNVAFSQPLIQDLQFQTLLDKQTHKVFEEMITKLKLPTQQHCACKYIYNIEHSSDLLNTDAQYHLRLYFIRILPNISVLNGRLITQKERALAIVYYQQEKAGLTEQQKYFIKPDKKIQQLPFEKHFFHMQDLIDVLQTVQSEKCSICKQLDMLRYMKTLEFPAITPGIVMVDTPSISQLFLLIFYLLDVIKYYQTAAHESALNYKLFGHTTAPFLRYLLAEGQISPYFIAEVLSINHTILTQQVLSPHAFINIAVCILRNDGFKFYFQQLLINNSGFEFKHRDFCRQNAALTNLFFNIDQQLKFLIKKVKLAANADQLPLDRVYNKQIELVIEDKFWENSFLSLNSVCYFQKCVHNKLSFLEEQVTVAHKNIVLNSVDLYRDFYEGLRAIDCQSVAKAKNEEPKEVELFGWYGNLKK
ncbi:Conserved_hypothetical protein [Hexamita inflata]|uniref:Uncharacterized protein n=1 Tax=Hexamita inflata TaxID=28002 RepID=A0AA86VML8_9EUKA|nr:Conserved hypothetical protein [Hexamita inflata]